MFLLIGAVIGFLISWNGCGNRSGNNEVIVGIDTVLNETYVDTNWYDTTVYKYLTVRVPVPYMDTTHVYDTIEVETFTSEDFDQMMRFPAIYEDSVTDDTISIKYKATVRGYMDKLEIGYKIYKPYSIVQTNVIQTEVTKAKKFNGFYLGLNAGTRLDSVGLSSFTPMLEASWRNLNVEAGYDFMNGSIEIGVKRRISFRKKPKIIPIP